MFKRKKTKTKKELNNEQQLNNEQDEHELDEILRYIEEHEEELIEAQKRLRKELPYWVCTF